METFKFTEDQYNTFKTFLHELKVINWGVWPDPKTWPTFPGLPSYSLNQYQQDNGTAFVVVKFDTVVIVPGRGDIKGKRFKVGGGRNWQPICEYF